MTKVIVQLDPLGLIECELTVDAAFSDVLVGTLHLPEHQVKISCFKRSDTHLTVLSIDGVPCGDDLSYNGIANGLSMTTSIQVVTENSTLEKWKLLSSVLFTFDERRHDDVLALDLDESLRENYLRLQEAIPACIQRIGYITQSVERAKFDLMDYRKAFESISEVCK